MGEMNPQLSSLCPWSRFTKRLLFSLPPLHFWGDHLLNRTCAFTSNPCSTRGRQIATCHAFLEYAMHTIVSQLIAPSIVHNSSLSAFSTFYPLLTCFTRNPASTIVARDFISINCMMSNKYTHCTAAEYVFFAQNRMLLLLVFFSPHFLTVFSFFTKPL